MNIQYYGQSCFKITAKPNGRATEDINIFLDPFDKSIGLRPPQGQADIVFVSHNHHDHNNVEALKGNPIVIDAPGEYAVKGINVIGLDSFHDAKEGQERGKNTIFILETEGLKLCHLGDLGENLTPAQIEKIGEVDILFIPIGGKFTIDGKKAAEIMREIEPAITIPMHFKLNGMSIDFDNEKKFCAETDCPQQKINKLNIKKKDLEGKKPEIVLMIPE